MLQKRNTRKIPYAFNAKKQRDNTAQKKQIFVRPKAVRLTGPDHGPSGP